LFADTTPLRTPDFRRLWLAGIVTVIGGNLTIFAVPVQLYALTQSSAYVGLSGLFALVPLIVFGLWGGAWADAMDRRLLLIITAVGLAASSVLLWLQAALALNNVWVVLCLLSLQQVFYAVNSPTRAAAIPRMLPPEQLPAANSLNMTVMQFGAIVGPLLAGMLLHFVDLSTLYLIDAVTCITPIWATVRLAKMPPIRTVDADLSSSLGSPRQGKFGFRAVLEGFRYLAGNQVVLMSFVVDLIAMIFGMPRALFPQMAHESFGGPVEGGTTMALLAAAMSVGAVAGGVFSGWLPRVRRQGLTVLVSIVVWGLAMFGFGVAAGAAHGTAVLALGGAADMVSAAFRSTILQEAASDDLRGRLQGVFTVVVAGGPRIADVAHGATAAVVGTTAAAAGGGLLVVIGVTVAALAGPAFARYRVHAYSRDDA
jgi:MFS family permease